MQWQIDPTHTSVEFAVRHLGISTVRGYFTKLSGTIETTGEGRLESMEATIDAGSIDTRQEERDAHLRSADFLDAARHPVIVFRSTSVTAQEKGRYLVRGNLTIRGVTQRVNLEVEITEPINDPWGNVRAAATGEGRLNRKDWGLTWNQVLEFGRLLVGDEARFWIEVEAVAKTPVAGSKRSVSFA